MKIIAFAGMPFSGKSEAVRIAKEKNIPVIRMGDMVWDEVKKRGLELNDKNVGTIANEMRQKHGKDIWAKKTIERVKSKLKEHRRLNSHCHRGLAKIRLHCLMSVLSLALTALAEANANRIDRVGTCTRKIG